MFYYNNYKNLINLKMKKIPHIFILALLLNATIGFAQNNTRISDNNNIGWYTYNGIFKINKKFGINTEYQFRRDNYITDLQQGLTRVGVNYQLNPNIQLRAGYAHIETFPYGDINLNGFGKDFTEHRAFELATVTDKISIVDFSHRFMLEQRWVGRYSTANLTTEDEFLFLNRFRYMFRMTIPLKGKSVENKTPYFAAYNEIFIGFGKNVNENVFDQNRIGLLLGYRFNKSVRIEGGYLNQIVQLGREVGGRNVFQYNNGIIVNTVFNFDLTKKK
jgi:hypothetical protein